MKVPLVLLASLCANSALTTALPTDQASAEKAVLVLRNGTTKAIETKDLESHLNGIPIGEPADNHQSFKSEGFSGLQKRGNAQFIIPLPDQEFLGWDIAMSSIIHANERDAVVAIAAGQSIANSVSVSASFSATVDKWLQFGVSTDYSETTTNTLTGTATQTIPKGKYGAFVSNPNTHRRSGYVFSGAPGNAQYEYFKADSFTPKKVSYESAELNWVEGVITTCLGDTYPLKMCNGDGVLK